MVFLCTKIIKDKRYHYLEERTKIKGKSIRTWQKYLGPADKIKEFYENNNGEFDIKSKSFGSIAAMLSVAEELNIEEIISKIVPDHNYKLSIYQHIIMQSTCRFNKPLSKKASIKWFKESILPLLWKKSFQSPQTIFNQFGKLVDPFKNKTLEMDEEICKVLLTKGIKPSTLIWDPTNFFTYIEKGEKLVQKGASKEKRFDKNIINLGLVVSKENIPLTHIVYEGNKRESDIITDVTESIYSRLKNFNFETDNVVFVFDKGNNSECSIPKIKKRFHIIGALRTSQIKHLLDIPISTFEDLYTNRKNHLIKGFKTKEKVYNENYTVVVTYNEESAKKQRKKTEQSINKISQKFKEIEDSFSQKKKGKKSEVKGLSGRINDFLHKQYRSLFSWKFDEAKQEFNWYLNENNLEQRKKAYGKNILFTDLENWTATDIAKTYNSKIIIESDYKVLKDKLLIPVKPFFSRKDPSLKVHVFICVLSILLYRYMLWKLKDLQLSEYRLTEELRNMRISFIKQEGSNSVKTVLENMTSQQIEIYSALNLKKYLVN